MSVNPGSFRPSELAGADSAMTDAEQAQSYAAARELELAVGSDEIHPSAGFANKVMASIAREPAPRPAGFLAPLQARLGVAGLIASVRAAWAIATNGVGRPVSARGLALAYVLPGPSEAPQASHEASEPSGTEEPRESLEASESPEASETAEPGASGHAEDSPAPGQTASPRETDDHGGATESPGASDDHGGDSGSPDGSDGSGSSDGSALPEPSDNPNPSD
jgi:hypothetical protein